MRGDQAVNHAAEEPLCKPLTVRVTTNLADAYFYQLN
jgi:hypothetical protein